jgi:hypothetical protein
MNPDDFHDDRGGREAGSPSYRVEFGYGPDGRQQAPRPRFERGRVVYEGDPVEGPPTSVTITVSPGEELTPDRLTFAARQAVAWLRMERAEHDEESWRETTGRDVAAGLRSVWDGKVTDLYLATLAEAYTEVVRRPFLKVIPTLAEMLGRSPNTIKMHVVRARDRGFLTGETGKAGGDLTSKARQLLDEHA